MSHHARSCPHCQAPLPEMAANEAAGDCPRCGEPLPGAPGTATPGPEAKRKGPAARSVLVAVAALTAIAVAGVASYRNIADELKHAFPGRAGAAAANAGSAGTDAASEDECTVRSRLIVHGAGKAGEARPVVILARPTGGAAEQASASRTDQGLLLREVIRQALLIAARDELGLATRDELLDDAAPAGQGTTSAEVAEVFPFDQPGLLEIRRVAGGKTNVLLKRELPAGKPRYNLDRVVKLAETLSRTEFPGTLKALGLEGKPNALRPEAELPGSVEERLGRLSLPDAFAAVRDLHAAIRADGESPERVGALVRGYALLGVLSEFHWSPAHKAFKARAILYAQRLNAREPKSPWGLRHLAFAHALAGLHRAALDDLTGAKARDQAEADEDAPEAPAWADLIDAYCRFDLGRLKVADGPHARLAALLRMCAVEYPYYSSVALHAAKDVLAQDPECFRAHDVMCQVGGVSNLHVATMIAPQVLAQVVPRRLRGIGTLPATVRDRLDRQAGEIALVEALDRAGEPGEDAGEPSWGVLGHLIRETRFVHAWRRLRFMRDNWGVPVDDFWAEERPHVAQHRFRSYLDALALPAPEAGRALADLIAGLDLTNLELTESDMTSYLHKTDDHRAQLAYGVASVHSDLVARDTTRSLEEAGQDRWLLLARKLHATSPHNPYAMARLIAKDWEGSRPHLAEWEQHAGSFPVLLDALATRYTELGELDKARDFLERSIRVSPDYMTYAMLAKNYKDRGDTTRWLETLEKFLDEGEDHGLNDARVRVEIANHYMELDQWTKAQPYAEAAAGTWAGWAMACAIRCYEGLKDWDRAETWAQRLSERYPNSSLYEWIFFSKRTGRGNAEAARDFVEQYLAVVGDRPDLVDAETTGYFYWLTGSPRKAIAQFRKAYETKTSIPAAFALVMMADQMGDSAQRDAMIDELRAKHPGKAPRTLQIMKILRESLDKGERGTDDLKGVDQILDGTPDEFRGNMTFLVGWYLRIHGKPEEARPYLERCTREPNTLNWFRIIATDALRVPGDDREPSKADPRTTS